MRKILIEIDSEDKHCGECEHLDIGGPSCQLFAASQNPLQYSGVAACVERCQQCLDAEVRSIRSSEVAGPRWVPRRIHLERKQERRAADKALVQKLIERWEAHNDSERIDHETKELAKQIFIRSKCKFDEDATKAIEQANRFMLMLGRESEGWGRVMRARVYREEDETKDGGES
jgi:hypothetical protein